MIEKPPATPVEKHQAAEMLNMTEPNLLIETHSFISSY
jgi:hypothetical protein